MAIRYPASLPTRKPDLLIGGAAHVSEDVEAVVTGHNFLAGKWQQPHLAQTWQAGEVRTTSAAIDQLLVFPIRPRLLTLGLWISMIWETDAAGPDPSFSWRLRCLDAATDSGWQAVGPGVVHVQHSWAAFSRPDQLSTMLLEVDAVAGVASVDLLALHLRDQPWPTV